MKAFLLFFSRMVANRGRERQEELESFINFSALPWLSDFPAEEEDKRPVKFYFSMGLAVEKENKNEMLLLWNIKSLGGGRDGGSIGSHVRRSSWLNLWLSLRFKKISTEGTNCVWSTRRWRHKTSNQRPPRAWEGRKTWIIHFPLLWLRQKTFSLLNFYEKHEERRKMKKRELNSPTISTTINIMQRMLAIINFLLKVFPQGEKKKKRRRE